ncbi:MAG: TlpA family protein disulfide reductase [Acidobacteria bacterium]|nr:TlpA family protein disulfide reductase [Acidobacteriota bacterium]
MFKHHSRTAAALVFAAAALASARGAGAQVSPQPAQTPNPAGGAASVFKTPAVTQQPTPTPAAPQPQGGTQLVRDAGHEWAPLLEQKIDYKDWTFKTLKDGTPVSLRELAKGKKLVMVVYFAPWCGNWKAEAPTVWRLYDKYKSQGFEVVGVSEYGSAEDSRKYFESQGGAPFPVVVESEAGDQKEKTTHYAYRKSIGDPRNWGSPFNVFLEPAKLNASGELLTEKAWVVGGELIEKDVERFVRERLGITEQGAVEQCKDEPKAEAKKQ